MTDNVSNEIARTLSEAKKSIKFGSQLSAFNIYRYLAKRYEHQAFNMRIEDTIYEMTFRRPYGWTQFATPDADL